MGIVSHDMLRCSAHILGLSVRLVHNVPSLKGLWPIIEIKLDSTFDKLCVQCYQIVGQIDELLSSFDSVSSSRGVDRQIA